MGVLPLQFQWAKFHHDELESNWRRAQKLEPLENIAPLE
jgi:hypothetical protein